MPKPHTEEYGWTAEPRNRSTVPTPSSAKTTSIPINVSQIWPSTPLVQTAQKHIQTILPRRTYNHSLRVYAYGHTIVTQHFPSWISSQAIRDAFFETWALTCLYHDVATTEQHRAASHLSFEWHGGFQALQELQAWGAPRAQAESVCEAIIRHQDPGETGMVSRMVLLVQMATEFGGLISFQVLLGFLV